MPFNQQTPTPSNPTVSIYQRWNKRNSIGLANSSSNPALVASSHDAKTVKTAISVLTPQVAFASYRPTNGYPSKQPAAELASSSATAQRRVAYFIRRGNKARRESLFRSLWTSTKRKVSVFQKYQKYTGRPQSKQTNIWSSNPVPAFEPNASGFVAFKVQRNWNQARRKRGFVQEKQKVSNLFDSAAASHENTERGTAFSIRTFSLAATPYVNLVGRRRGRRTVYKVRTLSRSRGQRQSLIALANTRHSGGAASKPFVERFKKQRSAILTPAAKDRKGGSSSANPLRDKRDELHQSAFANRPQHWRRND